MLSTQVYYFSRIVKKKNATTDKNFLNITYN